MADIVRPNEIEKLAQTFDAVGVSSGRVVADFFSALYKLPSLETLNVDEKVFLLTHIFESWENLPEHKGEAWLVMNETGVDVFPLEYIPSP